MQKAFQISTTMYVMQFYLNGSLCSQTSYSFQGKIITLIKTNGDNYNFVALSEIGKNKIENREEELKSKYGFTMKYQLPNSAKGGVGLTTN